MSVLQSAIAAASGSAGPTAYQIERSLRFNSADSAYLNWTPPQAGNRRTWTVSGWFKKSALSTGTLFSARNGTSGDSFFAMRFESADTLNIFDYSGSAYNWQLQTTQVFRDLGAWMHIVLAVDTTQATAANRVKLYINGVQVTAFSASSYPSQNYDCYVNNAFAHSFGASNRTSIQEFFNHYLTEVNFIDGQALTPSDFGETATATGVWTPKAYAGTYGQNGFYLPFNDNSTVLNLGRNRQTLTADPYFPVTTLLLNGNGSNGAQNNTFLDSSSNNFTITRNGNTTQGTFSPFSQSGWSGYFSGAQTSPSLSFPSNAAYSIGSTSDFTVEAWVYFTGGIGSEVSLVERFDGISGPGWIFGKSSGDKFWFGFAGSTYAGNTTVTANRWYHLCWMRTGGNSYLFVDGVLDRAAVATSNFTDGTAPLSIGERDSGSQTFPFTGYLSNLRIVKGTAVYSTSGFTVPTVPLTAITNTTLLTLQSNRFVDNSTTAATATVGSASSIQAFSPFAPTAAYSAATNGGSGYFDGTGDYLTAPSGASVSGSGAFTVEFWVYMPVANTGARIVSGGTNQLTVNMSSDGSMAYGKNGVVDVISVAAGTPFLGQWAHVVIGKAAGGTARIWRNGVSVGTATDSQTYTAGTLYVGSTSTPGNYLTGYISGLRITNTDVYGTSNTTITVPTAPPSAVTGSQLLCNFTNAGITDATAKNDLETVGGAQISTTQSKWGGSSLYFDGTGDRLYINDGKAYVNGTEPFTLECWVYLGGTPNYWTVFGSASSNGLLFTVQNLTTIIVNPSGLGNTVSGTTSLSAGTWYHLALTRNSANRFDIWLNGVSIGNATSSQSFGTPTHFVIGAADNSGGQQYNGYIDDLRVTKGYARYTGNFTVPQAQFAYNQADINVKQWVPNNFSVTAGVGNDSLVDSPTNYGTDTGAGGEVRGNYCTWNPLGTAALLGNGNLDFNSNGGGRTAMGSIYVSSGKWYAEFVASTLDSAGGTQFGVSPITEVKDGYASSWMYAAGSGNKVGPGSGWPGSAYGASFGVGDVIGVALNMDAGTVTCYKNGVSQGVMASGLTGLWTFCTRGDGTCSHTANFGQRPFAYTAPSGFKALCTTNLPTPAIGATSTTQADDYFNAVAYSGNSSTQTITTGFQPDLVWIKSRSTADIHSLQDVLRGARYYLISNSTAAEATQPDSDGVSSFTSTGFSLGYTDSDAWNKTGNTYISWAWKANGAGVSNTAGTITSTVSANTTAGISVVGYTGTGANATVGHGLGVAPKLIIFKDRTSGSRTGDQWPVYHASLGATKQLYLNATGAAGTASTVFNDTAPTSSVFSVGSWGGINYSGDAFIAYAFAEVAGFSRFGSFTGNGSADGPFVYCGFRPRFIMIKGYAVAGAYWIIIDTARDTYNVAVNKLGPNVSDAENSVNLGNTTQNIVDVLSNGFKLRSTTGDTNNGSQSYVFAAFAESPFNYARAR